MNSLDTLKIISTSTLLAILYGICHDLVTVNISVEYFTIGHSKIIENESPIYLALTWGIIATWWVGLILGLIISIATRFGKNPRLKLSEVVKPIIVLMIIMGGSAIAAGLLGLALAKTEVIYLVDSLADQIEPSRHHLFLAAGWAHGASYLVGFLGGIILCLQFWKKRKLIRTNT